MPARNRRAAFLVAAVALAASSARAETIDATSTTLLAGHQDARDGKIYTVVPLYEQVSLLATELKNPVTDDLKISLSGWGMMAFGDPAQEKVAGDLDLGFVDGKLWNRRIHFRLGRQFVVGGAARMTQFDGGLVDVRIWRGLGITGYGGIPVTPRFAASRGDAVVGGRMFWRQSASTEIGASFNQVNGEGRIARQDVGLDARWVPLHMLSLTGYGVYSLREMRLAEADLAATLHPHYMLEIGADYRRTAPDLFLPLNSIFSVFSQESRDEGGVNLYFHPHRAIRIYGDYHIVHTNEGISLGHRGGGKATFTFGPALSTTLGAEGRVLKLPENGYVEMRAFGIERLGAGFTITLDADAYLLDVPINGQNFSFTGAGTLGWDFAPGWKTVITAIGDVTPFVDYRFEFMAKLVYNHTLRFREVRQ